MVELGSGSGRSLLFLKKRLPDRRFVGLELSPVSVQMARRLSEKFALPVDFVQALAHHSGWHLQAAERLRTSTNPINETCRIHVART